MLVLTTMFINVSSSLPKTSYMKMVDAWLLFNLLYPFIVVLIHTHMDTLRDDEEREVNHHGKTVSVSAEPEGAVIKVKIAKLFSQLCKWCFLQGKACKHEFGLCQRERRAESSERVL